MTPDLRILALFFQLNLLASVHPLPHAGQCDSQGCIQAKKMLSKSINTDKDPCMDFYEFACGGFRNRTPIPDDKTHVDTFSFQKDNLHNKLMNLMTSPPGPDEPGIFDSVRNLYRSCMDDKDGQKSVDQMKKMLKDVGGWPVVEGADWNGSTFAWYDLFEDLNNVGLGIGGFIQLEVAFDKKDSDKTHLEVSATSLSNSPKTYLSRGKDDAIVESYYQFMVDTAVYFGAKEDTAKSDMQEVLQLEIALNNLMKESKANITEMTLGELKNIYDIPWQQYISNYLNNESTSEDKVVSVLSPEYILKFKELIKTVSPRVQANCLLWNAIPVKYLTPFREIHHKYTKVQTGQKKLSPRSLFCILRFPDAFNIAVGSMFVRADDYKTTKDQVTKMVEYIRTQLMDMIKHLDWMDDQTKKEAITKAKLVHLRISYPDEMLDNNKINEYYEGVQLSANQTYLQNQIALHKFQRKKILEKLKHFDKLDWTQEATVAEVNGYYNLIENSIIFPAGFTGGQFFNPSWPMSMNFGSMGFAIGHELTHGFDNHGSLRNEYGNTENWWEPATRERFLQRSDCILYQYGNMSLELKGHTLYDDGKKTLGENIADNGGIKIAYKSYQHYLADNGAEQTLPGLSFTPNQVFWLGAAHMWCSVERQNYLKHEFVIWTHSPHRMRVNGMMSNMKEFGDDWSCPLGSKMNPSHKCLVW